jgi:hypothetical protein
MPLNLLQSENAALQRKICQLSTRLAIKETNSQSLRQLILNIIPEPKDEVNYDDFENAPSKKTNAKQNDYQAAVSNSQPAYPICLPKFLSSKKAIININCLDNRSFGFSMLSYYKHPLKYLSNIENYREQDFINFNLANLSYPISPFDMAKMEQHFTININLFSFNYRDGSNLYTLYFGPHVYKETVNLIYEVFFLGNNLLRS